MSRILIVYASDYGNTEKMAQSLGKGVDSIDGVTALVKKADDVKADDMTQSHGIVIGSPVHMGSMDWRIKKFIDTVCSGLWMQNKMNGKVGGVFVTGSGFGNAGGGCEVAMLSILTNLAELGMFVVPLPKNTAGYQKAGLHWGPYGRSGDENMEHVGVSDEALGVAKRHGANIARAVLVLKDNVVFE